MSGIIDRQFATLAPLQPEGDVHKNMSSEQLHDCGEKLSCRYGLTW